MLTSWIALLKKPLSNTNEISHSIFSHVILQFMDSSNLFTNNFKLIIGLGNPGKKYQNTWHNMGFIFLDKLKALIDGPFNIQNKKEYELTTFTDAGIELLKPLTFMNNSGFVMANFLKQKNYKEDEILIVHDDLDIQFGEFKLQKGRFPKAHNGINSIHETTGKTDFWYLRIGIETRNEMDRARIAGEDYVVQQIPKNSALILEETLSKIFAYKPTESI